MRPSASVLALVVLLLAGCTFNTTVHRADDAPNVPRSDSAVVVTEPPRDAIRMGGATVRGNRNMAGAACVAEAVKEAKRMGATHLVVHPVETASARGVRCTSEFYYLGRIVEAPRER
jgi:hypothetical protein